MVAIVAAMVVGVVGAAAIPGAPGRASHDPGGRYCAGPVEQEMLALINDFRAGRGLEPLALSRPLGAAATHKSQEMANRGYFRHTSPDGVAPRQLLARHGYEHNTAIGENIAAGQESAAATFEQWRESASHRELMLGEDFTAVGIARAHDAGSRYDWYWTAEFGGVVGGPAEPCAGTPIAAGTPAAAATPAAPGPPPDATPMHLTCDGVVRADGTYELTCREAA